MRLTVNGKISQILKCKHYPGSYFWPTPESIILHTQRYTGNKHLQQLTHMCLPCSQQKQIYGSGGVRNEETKGWPEEDS